VTLLEVQPWDNGPDPLYLLGGWQVPIGIAITYADL